MTGMKEGPGDDPFADDPDADADETEPEQSDEPPAEPTTDDTNTTDTTMSTTEIPYVVRRQTVKEDRNNEHVAFLRDEYADLESDVLDAVADELDMRAKDVSVTDLREAFVELGSRHEDELAQILEDWGYEHLK